MTAQLSLIPEAPAPLVAVRERCEVNGPSIAYCAALDEVLVHEFPRQAPRVRAGVVMRPRLHGQRLAIVLELGPRAQWPVDFCPFCGASLVTTFDDAPEATP